LSQGQKRSQRVLVVHGRNTKARDAMFSFLRSLRLKAFDYGRAIGYVGRTPAHTIDVVNAGFDHADAVVILMTPDDEVRLRKRFRTKSDRDLEGPDLRGQARPNVLFEAGIAINSHPKQTILVELGDLRSLSDAAGIQTVRLDNSREKREELVKQLRNAGFTINPKLTAWRKAGNFDRALTAR